MVERGAGWLESSVKIETLCNSLKQPAKTGDWFISEGFVVEGYLGLHSELQCLMVKEGGLIFN